LTAKDDLAAILTWQETRSVSKNLTVQFEKVVYQIQTKRPSYALRNARVTICVNAQQQVSILYKGKSLPYKIYHHQVKQSEVVASKDVDAALKERVYPAGRGIAKPAPDHPWRNYPAPAGTF